MITATDILKNIEKIYIEVSNLDYELEKPNFQLDSSGKKEKYLHEKDLLESSKFTLITKVKNYK